MTSHQRTTSWSVVVAVTTSVSVALAALVAVTELDIAPVTSARPASAKWFALSRDRAMLLGVVTALSACAVTAGWNDLDRRGTAASGTTVAATLLSAGWAAVPVALWSSQAWLRAAAFAAAAVIQVALAHCVHSAFDGRTSARVTRPMAPMTRRASWTAAYLVVLALAVLHRLTHDPFLDPRCLEYCTPGTAPLDAAGLGQLADAALRTGAAAAAALVMGVAAVTLVRGAEVTARLAALVALVAGGIEAAWALGPVSAPVVGPIPFEAPNLLSARLLAHGAVAISVTTLIVLDARRRLRLRRMAREIVAVTPPNSVRQVLALRLDDPGARIEYAVEDDGLWVDEHGAPVGDARDPTHQVVTVERDGRSIARVRFTTGRADLADLGDALGPAAVLALEAERARAELLMRLRALQDLRRRVVEESDVARRRAERDLHDGAQHLLLAATFAIQEGLHNARTTGDAQATERLEHALGDVTAIAADLRAVAHGMYPVLLGDAGLVPALEGLAREAAGQISVDSDHVGRLDPSIELTVYEACAIAARGSGHGELAMSLRRRDGGLRLHLAGAHLPRAALEPLRDRVAALGGTMVSTSGSTVVEVPCA